MRALTPPAPDPLAPEERLGERKIAPRPLRAAVATVALAFFATPLLLGAVGLSGGRLPGERPVTRPSLSEGWDVFDSGARYLAANLPGRVRAVRANNWISRELLGSTPSYGSTTVDRALPFSGVHNRADPNAARTGGAERGHAPVFAGLRGWSFLQADLDRNCRQPVAVELALRRWRALVEAIRASGRRVVLLLAPEKSTIYPELLGPRAINGRCALLNKARMWSQIEAVRDRDIVGLRRPLAARKAISKEPLYLSVDSHWSDLGGVELVRRALEHVGGRTTIRFDELVRGTARYVSDVSRFSGELSYATTPTLSISRKGGGTPRIRDVALGGGRTAYTATMEGARGPLIRGRTLFLRDSYGDSPMVMLQYYAARLVSVNWQGSSSSELVHLIKRADTVIVEAVERSFLQVPSDLPSAEGGSVLTPKLLAELRRALRSR